MKLPNFLVIGTIKGGTTSIYHYLEQHPQIFMSPVKEARYFAVEDDKPKDWGINRFSKYHDLESYSALFDNVSDEKAIGEASPQYLYSSTAPEKIHSHIPDVKLIAVLRNPVDRAYSAFLHHVREGAEQATNFEKALQAEDQRIREGFGPLWHYQSVGFYSSQLARYFNLFNKKDIKVYLYEDLVKNSTTLVQDIFNFLEVDESFIPNTSVKHNISGVSKSRFVPSSILSEKGISKINKKLSKFAITKKLIEPVSSLLNKSRQKNLIKPSLTASTRAELNDLYKEDILRTQDMISRDLSSWLQ